MEHISPDEHKYLIEIQDQDAFDPSESAIMYSKSISIILTDPNIDIRMNRLTVGLGLVDMLQWMARAALEMVGQSGLGYSFDSLVEEETENAYARSVKDFLPTAFQLRFFQESTLSTIHKIGTPKFRRALMNFLPHKNLHKLKDIVDAMDNNSNMILDEKKRALEKGDEVLQDKIGQGKDIISILMKANLEASERDRLDKEEVVGQVRVL
ncbi:hypothetical protein H0H81_001579 [Sphagnurus paluster]|uniref:Uncharacterized protein n=1 Tax=Sphagnurus paluster TaxID=117069 RepID=A0A9P7G275_9AGAR|nr:hypothetical protein H0H81_001579 [Sphagnurus paluster]